MRPACSILLLTALSFFRTECCAQSGQINHGKIDTLSKRLPALTDSARVDCLNAFCLPYIRLRNDSVKYYANLAYAEANKINYIHGMAEALANQAAVERLFTGNFPLAEKLARRSVQLFEKSHDKQRIAWGYYNLGWALTAQSSLHEAVIYLDKSIYWWKEHNEINGLFFSLAASGGVHRLLGDYEKAFNRTLESLQLTPKMTDTRGVTSQLNFMGLLYRDIEDYRSALQYYRLGLQNNEPDYKYNFSPMPFAEVFSLLGQFDSANYYFNLVDTSNPDNVRFYLVSKGELYLLQKEYDKALTNFMRGLSGHKKHNNREHTMRTLANIANTYVGMHQYEKALPYARELLELARLTGSNPFTRDGYKSLYSAYEGWQKPDSAYFYYRKYINLKDAILTDQVKAKLMAYSYEQRVVMLGQEKLINQQELKIQRQHLQQALSFKKNLIAGMIILVILALVIFRNTILKRNSEAGRRELAENELQLQSLEMEKTKAALQQQATQLEMQVLRAQMNPHFIFNSLNSINRFILQNNKAQASGYLTKFSKLVRLILQNSQAPLIPLETELEALHLYLDLEALRFEDHFTYTVSVAKDIDTEILKVPPLIIQPYAENAIWHGLMLKEEKGHLAIEITQMEDRLLIKIIDDGIGRRKAAEIAGKPATRHKSMGLEITANRITMLHKLNGSESPVTINDLVNADGTPAGTEVLIILPEIYDQSYNHR
jgi:tetratricopeptide (TPR) repeat protein